MRATHGKTLAATLMAMLSGNALASNEDVTYLFKMNVEGEVNVPEWITINYIYGSWTNTGAPYNCASWSPGTETVDWGITFQQSRMCNQNQSRSNIPVMLNPVLGTTKNEESVEESRTINVSQFQPATGTRDFISGERADNWSAWVDSGSHYDCSSWSPTADTVNLNSAFQQSRDCSQNQTRSRQVFNVWASGLETPKRIDNESQTLSEQETKQSTGTRDFIAGQRVGSWSTWSNDGAPHSCTTWTPSPDTVNLDANYTQSRNCSQDQTGSRNIYDVWESGQETLNTTEERTQTITVNQTQGATGTKDYITSSSNGTWSEWVNDGAVTSCSNWSPSPSTVNLGDSYTQSRSCSQAQKSQRDIYDVWKSGKQTLNRVEPRSQTITVNQTQGATGSKDYITTTSNGSWSAWSDDGGQYNCSGWSPSPSSQTSNFTQSQSCKQNQKRTRTIYNVWKSGKKTAKSTETGSQTVNETNTRSVTVSWSAWSNDGGVTGCSGWSPSPSTVNAGTTFTQSRSCTQPRKRTRYYKVGSSTISSATESGSTSVSQSQSATGTKDYITNSNYKGSWSGWSNDGGQYSCSSWGASTATVDYGKSFTQTQTCKQNQKRSRTVYNQWHSGKLTARTTENDTQTVNVTNSRSATGTRNYITGARSSDGPKTYVKTTCGSWSPSTGSVNLGTSYTQKRTCYKTYSRTTTTYDVWADGSSTQKSTSTSTFNDPSYTESKSATGTKDYVVDSNYKVHSHYTYTSWSCGSWSPSTSSVTKGTRFTQTRDCTRTRKKYNDIYNLYKSGKKVLKSSDVYHSSTTQEKTESRSATGTKSYTWKMKTPALTCSSSATRKLDDYFGKSCTTPGNVIYVTEGEPCPRGAGKMQWSLTCS